MRIKRVFLAAAFVGVLALTGPKTARATLQLKLGSGNTSLQVVDTDGDGRIFYGNADFDGRFDITLALATSTAAYDGDHTLSELSLSSFTIANKTGSEQSLTLMMSDIGFDPNSSVRPLTVYNTASATTRQLSTGSLSYQTFAYDGSGEDTYFRTSGPGVTSTEAVNLNLPSSDSLTTSAYFYPVNGQFSLTGVMTITLSAGGSLTGFNGDSLVHAPEPGTFATACIGLTALAFGGRIRRKTRRVGDEPKPDSD
jgi:hypothetical protein